MRMHQFVLSVVTLALSATAAFAGGDTEFTYQGRLLVAGEPANGMFNVGFSLWNDPTAGNQIDATNTFNSLPILEGLFTVELDFGASSFDNNDRWLEITIDGVPLAPRQPITRTPYAIQTRGIFVDDADNIGIRTNTPMYPLHIESNEETAIFARANAANSFEFGGRFESNSLSGGGVFGSATASSGVNFGGRFENNSTSGSGVLGLASAASGFTYGGLFENISSSGSGVFGNAVALSGTTYGVFGVSRSSSGHGVFGRAGATTGTTYGGRFESDSIAGLGVFGVAFAGTGVTYGGRFETNSISGHGVFGESLATTGFTYGVYGQSSSTSGRGVFGLASATTGATYGLFGRSNSTSGHGVYGQAITPTGITYGGRFESLSTSGFAGYFAGNGNDAVYVENTGGGRGLQAVAPSDTAVWGRTTTGFAGVHGANAAATGRGVYGQASDTSGTNYGVYGRSDSASGFDFYAGGAGVNYGASSSRRWKNNVVPISEPLVKLAQLRGVYFDWDEEHGGAHDVGMIAEEVGAVLPEVVQYEENGIDASGMDYSKMTPLLVEAVNALRAEKNREITSLRAENSELRAEKDREIKSLRAEKDLEIGELRAENVELQRRFAKLESLVLQLTTEND